MLLVSSCSCYSWGQLHYPLLELLIIKILLPYTLQLTAWPYVITYLPTYLSTSAKALAAARPFFHKPMSVLFLEENYFAGTILCHLNSLSWLTGKVQ